MRFIGTLMLLTLILSSCQPKPAAWNGSTLSQPREELGVEALLSGQTQALMDMSYFAKPDWAGEALYSFSGTLTFQDSDILFPKEN